MEDYFGLWLNGYMAANGLRGDRQNFGFDALEEAFDAGFDQSKENLQALINIQNKELAELRRMLPRGYFCTVRTCYCGAVETTNSRGAVVEERVPHTPTCVRGG